MHVIPISSNDALNAAYYIKLLVAKEKIIFIAVMMRLVGL